MHDCQFKNSALNFFSPRSHSESLAAQLLLIEKVETGIMPARQTDHSPPNKEYRKISLSDVFLHPTLDKYPNTVF